MPTCPSEALYYGDLNDPDSSISQAMADATEQGVGTKQLRDEKQTRPRMWFAGEGPVEIEERVPREGESYSPEAYNIYRWKEASTDE